MSAVGSGKTHLFRFAKFAVRHAWPAVVLPLASPLVAWFLNAWPRVYYGRKESGWTVLTHASFWAIVTAITGLYIFLTYLWNRYREATFSPEWPLRFQDRFDRLAENRTRSRAASVCSHFISHKEWPTDKSVIGDVEEVLDFFEDLGFYMENWLLSPETLHHHFYHWARIYIQSAGNYIVLRQSLEPTCWRHCRYLLDKLSRVEARLSRRRLSHLRLTNEKLLEYLSEEIMPDELA